MLNRVRTDTGFDRIPFRMHPRVFAALGADLVTNDVVAVIELVKNSYDAFASNVWIRFGRSQSGDSFLEIKDDGQGMTREVIENAWCVVATPFRKENPYTKSGNRKRRVAGEKGLGRLSVARLGNRVYILTQATNGPCWEVRINWSDISRGDDLSSSFVQCRQYPSDSPFSKSGTRIRVFGLNAVWNEGQIADLKENLARLISPFAEVGEFNMFLTAPDDTEAEPVKITSPEFLSKPKYSIEGEVDDTGNITATYRFNPLKDGKPREDPLTSSWKQVHDDIKDHSPYPLDAARSHCGPFTFELRAWDSTAEARQEIAEKFDFQKSSIAKAIKAHKGISVYRDKILVLPKSDTARDWLGLDLRRVSRVGTRLSTSQLVGYVAISADKNPDIEDTSDRERLASCPAVAEFEGLLCTIVGMLENQRDADRLNPELQKPLEDLFHELSAETLVSDITELAEEGAQASDVVQLVQGYSAKLDQTRKIIQQRFAYYSRLATVGTIAQMLVHEIRNRTTAFGSFLSFIKDRFGPFKDKQLQKEYDYATDAVNSLERLADTFLPLASRSFRRRTRNSVVEERIDACLTLQKGDLRGKTIECIAPRGETRVAVDPGELDAILLNLITNAVYWLGQSKKNKKVLKFQVLPFSGGGGRLRILVHDNGPGLSEEDLSKVFWPGFTKKPGGIGMGLTVASELVAEYGGRMSVESPGMLGGASFTFDLPVKGG
jgi:signal transduction histidine kinase